MTGGFSKRGIVTGVAFSGGKATAPFAAGVAGVVGVEVELDPLPLVPVFATAGEADGTGALALVSVVGAGAFGV
jgi:hypothetical protein